MLPDRAAVDEYARKLGAVAVSGYTGPDGGMRAIVEITPEAAGQEIAEMARRIEQQSSKLRVTAEGMRDQTHGSRGAPC
jgi:hypothetical protein